MLLLPEGQTVEVREPPKKKRSFGNQGALDSKVLSFFYQLVFKGLKHGISPITQTKLTQ